MQRATKFIKKLAKHTTLNAPELNALTNLEGIIGTIRAGTNIRLDDSQASHCCIVLEGMVARTGYTAGGKRQITGLYVPGDMPDIQTLLLPDSAGLDAVCETTLLRVSRLALKELIVSYPALGEAFCREAVSDFRIATDWIINIGQRPAKARVAHLICELSYRIMEDITPSFDFAIPLTQTQIANATGMSPVHVNRVMHVLKKEKVLNLSNRRAYVLDWQALQAVAEFESGYLSHSPQRLTPQEPGFISLVSRPSIRVSQ